MSFEGFYQVICVNGHYSQVSLAHGTVWCTTCDRPIVWANLVDDTNGEAVGEVNVDSLKIIGKDPRMCEQCGGTGVDVVWRFEPPGEGKL